MRNKACEPGDRGRPRAGEESLPSLTLLRLGGRESRMTCLFELWLIFLFV